MKEREFIEFMTDEKVKTHCVYFYTEGLQVDGVPTIDLRSSVEQLKQQLTDSTFHKIHAYRYNDVKAKNPKMVEYTDTPGMWCGGRHGFYRWKSFILLDVMKNGAGEGDVIVYTDCHIEKYPQYVKGLRELGSYAAELLEERGTDFWMGTENETMRLEEHCKREVIEELGLNYDSLRGALLLNARVIIIRNTEQMREKIVHPWLELCENTDWIRKDIDDICLFESQEKTTYRNHTEDQSLLNLVVRQAQVEGILSWDIGQFCFRDRCCIKTALYKVPVSGVQTKEKGGFLLEDIKDGFQRMENEELEVQRCDTVLSMKIKKPGKPAPWRWIGKYLKRGDYMVHFEILFRGMVPERGENRGWKLHHPERIYNDFLEGMKVGEWKRVEIGCQVKDNGVGIFIWDGLDTPNEILLRRIKITKLNFKNHTYQHYLKHFAGIPFEDVNGVRSVYMEDGMFCLEASRDVGGSVCVWKKSVPLRGTYRIRFQVYFGGCMLSVKDTWGLWLEKPERILNRWAKDLSPNVWHTVEFVVDIVENETIVGFLFENVLKKGDIIKMRDFEELRLH
jgi:hypothetical protein